MWSEIERLGDNKGVAGERERESERAGEMLRLIPESTLFN